MADKKRQEFFLKRFYPMMFALVLDVGRDFRQVGFADAECSIFVLPRKTTHLWQGVLDPFGRAAFQQLQGFAHGLRAVSYTHLTKMLSVPRQKAVRGYSFYGFSFVYVIFEDGTDPYWARSRVLEYLSGLSGQLPKGVTPSLGPDATGVGWAFMYSINSTNRDLAEPVSYTHL